MRRPLSSRFVDKSESALASAVEIYNKPSFAYREETFALLMLNAWELLLKAKVLHENDNDVRSIRVYEKRRNKSGDWSKKIYVRRNRSQNPVTLSVAECIRKLDDKKATRLSPEVKINIIGLTEIRDNAAHFIQASPVLAKQVLEIGTASIQNFVVLCRKWFKRDMSRSLSLILPLSFVSGATEAAVVSVSSDERNLISYLERLGRKKSEEDSGFNVAVRLDIKLQRSKLDTASIVEVTNDPGAMKVTLSEEDIRKRYPWEYSELVDRLRARYPNFKMNSEFYKIKSSIMDDPKFVNRRLLDPGNPKGIKKDFYNPNVLSIFDKHYEQE